MLYLKKTESGVHTMVNVTLGRTGITVQKNGFGALPIQRISRNEAAYLLQKALDGGFTFFDTARDRKSVV